MSLVALSSPRHDQAVIASLLPEVSRTFALSIAALPDALRHAVGTAYLLCRILDTWEDDVQLPHARREAWFATLQGALTRLPPDLDVAPRPDAPVHATPAEIRLLHEAPRVLRAFHALPERSRQAIQPWVEEMGRGMLAYCRRRDPQGRLTLDDVADLERYCWFVAGTVGQLLTGLFSDHLGVPDTPQRRQDATRFGLGLQWVNILKDVRADAERGVCWLPQELLANHGLTTEGLGLAPNRQAERRVLQEGATRAAEHLRAAGRYAASWPADDEAGQEIRRFCLVPLALAWLTLREITQADPDNPSPPKVSRDQVFSVVQRAEVACRDDLALRRWLEDLERI